MNKKELTKARIDYTIGVWCDSDSETNLLDFLGWTKEEYKEYVQEGIIPARELAKEQEAD